MKYLTEDIITSEYHFEPQLFEPISTDTYDETLISQEIKKQNVEQLFACALQFAIIGTGGNSFGKIKISGVEHNVETLIKSNNVKHKLSLNAKLGPGELTLRRLARFFRFHISEYIKTTGTYSFLFLKYADSGYPEYTFPCAEYFINKSQLEGLLSAYQALDQSLGTRFKLRVMQVLRSRKVINLSKDQLQNDL
jgi:hypothetical protein